jgi:hypothetical protein
MEEEKALQEEEYGEPINNQAAQRHMTQIAMQSLTKRFAAFCIFFLDLPFLILSIVDFSQYWHSGNECKATTMNLNAHQWICVSFVVRIFFIVWWFRIRNRPITTQPPFIVKQITHFSMIWFIIGWVLFNEISSPSVQESCASYTLGVLEADLIVRTIFLCFGMAMIILIAVFACCCMPIVWRLIQRYAPSTSQPLETKLIDTIAIVTYPPKTSDLLSCPVDCSICLTEYETGNELRKLPCNHYFHKTCIDRWLSLHNSCPLDRKPITIHSFDPPQPESLSVANVIARTIVDGTA